jgi:DNA-binding NarL/FixJ family response regulator
MNCEILVVEDHPLFAEAVHSALSTALDVELHHASSLAQAKCFLAAADRLDLLLLDLWLPDTHGFEGLIELRRCFPKVPIVVLSAFADTHVVEKALVCGASGFISKATARDELVPAVKRALAGDLVVPSKLPWLALAADNELRALAKRLESLTRQQLRVLEMLCQGLLNKQIAHVLEVGETTVKAHVSEVLRKLNVSSRTQAVLEISKLDFRAVLAIYESAGSH